MTEENDSAAQVRFDEAVKTLQRDIGLRPADKKMSIKKNSPSHQIHNSNWKDKTYRVDVAAFNEILGYQRRKKADGSTVFVAVCGGQVQMGQLSKAAIARGYVPKVVPEYDNFTVAGLINGEGIQSSAYKHGVFTHTLHAITVVLGNGEVMYCSEQENEELFANMPETYGTLGIVVSAEVELTPALPFVKTTYSLYNDRTEFVQVFDKAVREGKGAYLEGLVLSPTQYLLIHSSFASSAEGLPQFDPYPEQPGEMWYYTHYIMQHVVDMKKNKLNVKQDAIPVYSFLFRPIRGAWWMTECHVNLPFMTKHSWFRKMVDQKLLQLAEQHGGWSSMPSGLSREEEQRCLVLQDMGIKMVRLEEGIKWVQDRLGVYPLWLCPVSEHRNRRMNKKFAHMYSAKFDPEDPENKYVVDIGVYGEPTVLPMNNHKTVRDMQEFVDFPSKWGVSYESPETIRERHRPIREKYHAQDVFPGVEEKTTFKGKQEERDLPSIFAWRLVRDHGHYWPLKFATFFAVLFTVLYFIYQLLF